jgi:TonB family protein
MIGIKKESKYIGLIGTLIVHVAIILLLVLIGIAMPKKAEESGVPVMMGNVQDALGDFDPSSLVKVDVMPQVAETAPASVPDNTGEEEVITQEDEQTVAIASKKDKKKDIKKNTETQIRKKTPAEIAVDNQKLQQQQRVKEQQALAASTSKMVSGAFGKGARMGSRGTTKGTGSQGVVTGNSSRGALSGIGGYGTYDLGGRSIGYGGLPRPVYNVQEEGKVVVSITVNPAGEVIMTRISSKTNTVSTVLRRAAEDAARKARFNSISGSNNQVGTITYYFKLK